MSVPQQTLCLFLLFLLTNLVYSSNFERFERYEPNWDSLDKRPLPSWFDESKIGIFLHWGLFSVPSYSSEWFWWQWQGSKQEDLIKFMSNNYRPGFTYGDFANQFTAEFYDPDKWAEIFKASGAKYIVLTSKHHEGFTLWPSKVSWNWNAMDVGPKRDLLGDLADSVRKMNLTFGVYHSLFEWFNPLYLQDKDNLWNTQDFVNRKTLPELEELVNIYKPEVIWSDGDWEAPDTYWNSTGFLAWLYNDSPVKDTILVNDRWGDNTRCKHGGYYNCDDRFNPGVLQKHKWENAMTLDRDSWGYRREATINDILTINELLTTLAETISCGGNLLINIGPTHDGRIIPIFEDRLRQLGYWLSINGDAIYKSKPWKHQNDTITKNIWYTQNTDAVYSIVLEWPQQNRVILGAVKADQVSAIQLVGVKGNLYFTKTTGGSTLVSFPQLNPDSDLQWAYVLRITFK